MQTLFHFVEYCIITRNKEELGNFVFFFRVS